jgi:hypothetical protein
VVGPACAVRGRQRLNTRVAPAAAALSRNSRRDNLDILMVFIIFLLAIGKTKTI